MKQALVLNRKENTFFRPLFLAQLLVWWGANNLYAVDAHKVLRRFDSPLLFIELTVVQIFVGIFMSLLISFFFPPSNRFSASNSSILERLTPFQIQIGLVHLLGTVLTNASYLLIGSTSTLVWKLTEPLAALILKRIVLSESSSFMTIFGTLLVVFGVLIFSVNSLPVFSLSPIILANLSFPIRNVLVKKHQASSNETEITTNQRYYLLLSSTLPVCSVMIMYKILHSGLTFEAYPFLIRNAILCNSYQLASISILEQMEALTHSLANTMKRFTGIILSFLALGEILEVKHLIGLALTIIGFPIYAIGKFDTKLLHRVHLRWYSIGLAAGITFLTFFGIISAVFSQSTIYSIIPQSDERFSESTISSEDIKSLPIKASEWYNAPIVKEVKHLNFRSAPKDIPVYLLSNYTHQEPISYDSYEDALTRKTANLGDMVWQYSSYIRLVNLSDKDVCQSFGECHKRKEEHGILMYRPSANMLNPKFNHSFGLETRLMENGNIPFIVGIGAQDSFATGKGKESVNDLNPDGIMSQTPDMYDLKPGAKGLLKNLEKNKHPILVRGDFTLRVTQLAGYNYGIATGCPSLMMNEEVHLGRVMQRKYGELMKREGDFSLKVAININGKPRLLEYLLEIFYKYPNSLIYAQGLDDIKKLNEFKVPFNRVRIFTNLDEWMKSISEMDVSIGARIHGNMIALGNSVPIFLIPPDFRVLELAQKMNIPHMHIFDKRWKNRTLDVVSVIRMSSFNGEEFDVNRCNIAKVYRYVFWTQGLQVNEHVKQISEIC